MNRNTAGDVGLPNRNAYLAGWVALGSCLLIWTAPGVASADAPYPPSPVITGVSFDMDTVVELAPGSDNWAITWADDDHQYTSWGDGGGFGGTNSLGRESMGFGRVEGPRDSYSTHNVWGGHMSENPATFSGKSYGLLSVGASLYMWRCGDGSDASAYALQQVYRSTNHAAAWTAATWDLRPSGSDGVFCPTFLQFGQDYAGSRDDYVYTYAPEIQNSSWDVQMPGEIALMRVPRDRILERAAYEFFAGMDSGSATWTSDFGSRQPVFEDAVNGVMRTSAIFIPGIDRYILITQQVGRQRGDGGHMGICDAPEPWGPWTTVLFANPWDIGLQTGDKTVFWNISPKWLSPDGTSFVLVYTGPGSDSWGTVEGVFEVSGVGPADAGTAGPDAGHPDAAPPLPDSGAVDGGGSTVDSGRDGAVVLADAARLDAGTPPMDAGAVGDTGVPLDPEAGDIDAGEGSSAEANGNCSCRTVGSRSRVPFVLWFLGAGGWAVILRRRSRRR